MAEPLDSRPDAPPTGPQTAPPKASPKAPPKAPSRKTRRGRPRGPSSALHKRVSRQSLLGWRLAQQLSQRDAASVLGISQSSYAKLELERRYVRGRLAVKKFQLVTGLPTHVLMGIDE
jgi:DNA-binding XRE family transcriptional regulator